MQWLACLQHRSACQTGAKARIADQAPGDCWGTPAPQQTLPGEVAEHVMVQGQTAPQPTCRTLGARISCGCRPLGGSADTWGGSPPADPWGDP